MFNKTITIYNRIAGDEEDSYHKTKISGVFYIKDEAVSIGTPSYNNSDVVFVIIPKDKSISVRTYVEPFVFDELSPEDLDKYYTIRSGDFLSFGDQTGDDLSLEEYRNKTGNAYEISAVGDYDFGGLKHFEVNAH